MLMALWCTITFKALLLLSCVKSINMPDKSKGCNACKDLEKLKHMKIFSFS